MSTRTVSCLFLGLNDGSAAMGFKVKPLTHGRPTFSLPSCSFFCLPVDIQHRVEEEENLFLYIILFKLQQSSSCVNIFVQYSPLYFPFSWARVSRSGWDRYITSTSEIDQKNKGGGETDRPLIVKKKTLSSPCAEFRRHFFLFCLVSSGGIFWDSSRISVNSRYPTHTHTHTKKWVDCKTDVYV